MAKVSYLFGQFLFWLLVSIPTVILASLTYFGFSSIWHFATADLAQERKDYLETQEALCRQLDDPQTIEACLEDRYKGLIAESVYAFGALIAIPSFIALMLIFYWLYRRHKKRKDSGFVSPWKKDRN